MKRWWGRGWEGSEWPGVPSEPSRSHKPEGKHIDDMGLE